jgi:hypothetical protein
MGRLLRGAAEGRQGCCVQGLDNARPVNLPFDYNSVSAGPGLQPVAGHAPPPSGSLRADLFHEAVAGGGHGAIHAEAILCVSWR